MLTIGVRTQCHVKSLKHVKIMYVLMIADPSVMLVNLCSWRVIIGNRYGGCLVGTTGCFTFSRWILGAWCCG